MILLEEKLVEAKDRRVNEIAEIKVVALRSGLSDLQKQIIKKYAIPAFYSLWEGYFKEAAGIYISSVNSMHLPTNQLAPLLLAHSIDTKHKLYQLSGEFDKRADLIINLRNDLLGCLPIPTELPTESNINFKVANNILRRLCIRELSSQCFKEPLNKFLFFRNRISHGDFSIPIEQENIDEFSSLVEGLMDQILLNIIEGYSEQAYLDQNYYSNP